MSRWTWSYGLPIVGDFFYNYDRMKDFNNMHKDYVRNTGRTYAYPTQGFEAQKYRTIGRISDDILNYSKRIVGRGLGGRTGSTTKDVTSL